MNESVVKKDISMFHLLFAVLVVVVVAEPTKPGCCVPPQWEGRQGSIVGTVIQGVPSVTQENDFIAYDQTNQRIYYEVTTETKGVTTLLKIIQDYSKGRQYVIDLNTQSCSTFPISTEFQKICLPADAKPAGKFYFGTGDKKFTALAFQYYTAGTNVTVVGTPEDCIPMYDVLTVATSGSAQMTVTGFVNITPGIRDPSIFNVPSACKQADPSSYDLKFKRRGHFRF